MGTEAPLTREVGTVYGFGRTVNAEDALTGTSDELTGLSSSPRLCAPATPADPWSTAPVRSSASRPRHR